ncbi:MAG: 50S ribosomal protein L31 [Anaerolineae bacterium]|nr:50S ribosomal protein L31 [Anaerolineae bacterium]
MKEGLHPTWYPDAKVICACGEVWTVGSSVKEIHTDICAKCHPYFTGEQRIVDTEGQVDRFMRRLRAREEAKQAAARRRAERTSPELPISRLDLNKRLKKLLSDAGIEKVGDVLQLLETGGDETLTDIKGFGLKTLADLKKGLRAQGFVLPGDESSEEIPQSEA